MGHSKTGSVKTWFPSSRNSQPKLRYELVSLKIYLIPHRVPVNNSVGMIVFTLGEE